MDVRQRGPFSIIVEEMMVGIGGEQIRGKRLARYVSFVLLSVMPLVVGCFLHHTSVFQNGMNLKGFERAGPLVIYNAKNLFDYIDGEAEVYFPFGFQRLFNQSYRVMQTGAGIVVDAYAMGTYEGAHGVYERYTEEGGSGIEELGESAWTDNYIILFRQGRYFFRIWPDSSPESKAQPSFEHMLELSRALGRELEKEMR